MKTVQMEAYGTPHEVCRCVDVPEVEAPRSGELLVEMTAFPINPVDLLTIQGLYATKPPLPAIPGSEGAGRVVALGDGVSGFAVGDPVLVLARENWRQRRCLPADQVLKVSTDLDDLQLAMLKINPATALMMLRDYVDLAPGDWVIQNAANSSVGACVIGLAKTRGLRSVNVVRRESLIEPLRAAGADVVLVDGEDLPARVAAATGGAELRLGIDAVSGEACLRLSRCLSDGGTVVNYGMLSGAPCMLSPDDVVFRGLSLTGFWLAQRLPGLPQDEKQRLYDELGRAMAEGLLPIEIEATYPIEEITAALADAEREGRDGKILV